MKNADDENAIPGDKYGKMLLLSIEIGATLIGEFFL